MSELRPIQRFLAANLAAPWVVLVQCSTLEPSRPSSIKTLATLFTAKAGVSLYPDVYSTVRILFLSNVDLICRLVRCNKYARAPSIVCEVKELMRGEASLGQPGPLA